MKNPCRNCKNCYVWKNRHTPSFKDECNKCERYIQYKQFLQSQRKFEAGEPIKTIDELLSQEWVIWNGMTRHIEFVKNNQLNVVLQWLDKGFIRKAVRRDLK